MAISDIKQGEVQFQSPEIISTNTDLKSVTGIELSNITPDPSSTIKLGVDLSVMMRVVTDSMYKDKLIPIQELTANGWDAIKRRIELGDTDFLPEIIINLDSNTHEITFTDNGCGMTREQVETIYSVFGGSDKRNIANEVGMFGLGAKCFLALTDTATVRTVSMKTHKLLEFIFNKRIIEVLQDEVPTDLPVGTTIKFTIPNNYYNYYNIEARLTRTVSSWRCPVFLTEDNKNKKLLSSPKNKIVLSDMSEGYYPELGSDTILKYSCPDFSFILSNRHSSLVYIGHIPYDLKLLSNNESDFPIPIKVILHNPNLLTLVATREGIEADSKFKDLVKTIRFKILEILTPYFEKYFKHLPQNLSTISEVRNFNMKTSKNLLDIFESLSNSNIIDKNKYPFFNLLNTRYDYYDNYSQGLSTDKLNEILSKYKQVYYTPKKLSPAKSVGRGTIILSHDTCEKFCLFCLSFNNTEGYCSDSKIHNPFITTIIGLVPPLPATPRIKHLKTPNPSPLTKTGINAKLLHNHKGIRISSDSLPDYIYTSNSFETSYRNIVLVTEKQLKRLKSEHYKTVSSPEEYQHLKVSEIYLTDVEGVEISAELLKNYDLIITSVSQSYQTEIIKLIYPKKNLLLLKNSIPQAVEDYYPKEKFMTYNDFVSSILQKQTGSVKITLELPISRLDTFYRNKDYYAKLKQIKKLPPIPEKSV
jgi:hypothetical protein